MTFTFFLCMLLASAIIVLTFLKKRRTLNEKSITALVAITFAAALAMRLLIGYFGDSFVTDIDLFKFWGRVVNEVGFKRAYNEVYIDYPPAYLYILTLLEKLRLLFGLEESSAAYTFMLKLPSIMSDMLTGLVIYKMAEHKASKSIGLFLAFIFLFNPVIFFNSAQWGQVDSICTLVLLLSMYLLYNEKYIGSAVVYGLSIALKPQMLIFVPVYVFFMMKKRKPAQLALGIVSALMTIILFAIPFSQGADFMWLIDKYIGTMEYYNFYSVNAFNIWGAFGLNWEWLPEEPLKMLLTAAGPVLATVLCGAIIFRHKGKDSIFIASAALMAVVYIFTVKMHERYLYTIFAFILAAYIFVRDRRLLYAYSTVSFIHFICVYLIFHYFEYQGGYYEANSSITVVLSAFQVLVCCYLIYVIFSIYVRRKILPETPDDYTHGLVHGEMPEQERELKHAEKRLIFGEETDARLCKRDILIMVAIALVYAAIGFWQLGSNNMPDTPWLPKEGESVVLEAEDYTDTITYIAGIAPDSAHYASRIGVKCKLETSDDMKTWEDHGELYESHVFDYKEFALPNKAKYIRLTAVDGKVTINEVLFRKYGEGVRTKAKLVSGDGEALVDEQEGVPLYPTYYDETYFDEIYHARTAYEHILGLEPYENTHPPLGKLIIAAGIKIFGMNPFGWRFMGALFGVLMLPALYHLIKQLTGKTFLAAVGTLLFAFDFMHLTQTRIATIDTYAVFFILLMFDAMVVFMRKDIKTESMRSLLTPLAFSGVFMGLGAASKWTVLYGAVGLAAVFFIKLYAAYKNEKHGEGETEIIIEKIIKICAWCCLWFIAIPFAIYFVAFLPQTTLPHNSAFESFISYQKNMYGYHSTLEASHPFASAWYEWPIDYRPIWFYDNKDLGELGKVSTITSMGNPALWWAGIPAMIGAAILAFKEKSKACFVALIGFAAVYLPWILVPRISFIYHYFTAVPFLVIALMICFDKLMQLRHMRRGLLHVEEGESAVKVGHAVIVAFTVICIVLFALYFPVISGVPTTEKYANALELFPTWYFS